MMPITPNGANSSRQTPFEPLVAFVRRNSTPGTSSRIWSFSILWSSRPIFVSSSSILPQLWAFCSAIDLISLTIASRSSSERRDELLLRLGGRGDGVVDLGEDAVLADGHVGAVRAGVGRPRCGSLAGASSPACDAGARPRGSATGSRRDAAPCAAVPPAPFAPVAEPPHDFGDDVLDECLVHWCARVSRSCSCRGRRPSGPVHDSPA
jgi:hypothetical protein